MGSPRELITEEHVLKVVDLEVKFFTYAGVVHAVSGVSFEVFEGEVVSLVGETGCGKTVTTRAITRLIDPPGRITKGMALYRTRSGSVVDLLRIPDEELRRIRGDEIAYVFQDPTSALDPLYTIGGHIVETVRAHRRVPIREIMKQAVRLLSETLIPNPELRVKSYPHELSGGMRQRSVISIALSNNPRLLIADEPTTNLDVTVQAQILDLLRDLRSKYSMSLILITHNLGIVAEMSDRVYVMYAGKIVEEGATEEIFYSASHPYTYLLLKAVPNPAKKVEKLETIPGTVPSLINPGPGCRFEPRCPYATERCAREEPPLVEVGRGHKVACWLPDRR